MEPNDENQNERIEIIETLSDTAAEITKSCFLELTNSDYQEVLLYLREDENFSIQMTSLSDKIIQWIRSVIRLKFRPKERQEESQLSEFCGNLHLITRSVIFGNEVRIS